MAAYTRHDAQTFIQRPYLNINSLMVKSEQIDLIGADMIDGIQWHIYRGLWAQSGGNIQQMKPKDSILEDKWSMFPCNYNDELNPLKGRIPLKSRFYASFFISPRITLDRLFTVVFSARLTKTPPRRQKAKTGAPHTLDAIGLRATAVQQRCRR